MTDVITWVNSMGFGDCFWTSQYLTKLGGLHRLHCREHHHADLQDLFPHILFHGMNDIPENAIDCWIGASAEYSWHAHLLPRDLIDFLCGTFFEGLSRKIGQQNPMRNREDMLYNCRVINPITHIGMFFLNAHPRSGQVSNFTEDSMRQLNDLIPKPATSSNSRFDAEPLGRMFSHAIISQSHSAIAGVATGPIWPCLSRQNTDKTFYVLLDQVFLDYGPSMTIHHFSTVADMAAKLREDGWL